jgi:hypothetical protein
MLGTNGIRSTTNNALELITLRIEIRSVDRDNDGVSVRLFYVSESLGPSTNWPLMKRPVR